MEDEFQARNSAPPIRPSRFACDIEQLLGDDLDLDPLFFRESWALGKSASLENLRRRLQWKVEREMQHRATWNLEDIEKRLTDRAA